MRLDFESGLKPMTTENRDLPQRKGRWCLWKVVVVLVALALIAAIASCLERERATMGYAEGAQGRGALVA